MKYRGYGKQYGILESNIGDIVMKHWDTANQYGILEMNIGDAVQYWNIVITSMSVCVL